METFETLCSKLKNENSQERIYAVEDLVVLNDTRVIKFLAEQVLEESTHEVRETMLDALMTLCTSLLDPIVPLFHSSSAQIRNGAVALLNAAGESLDRMSDTLSRDSNKDVRKFALDALKSKKSAAAIATLRAALNDEDMNVRMTAVEYLGGLEDRDSAPGILAILKAEPPIMLTATCLEALAKIKDPEVSRKAIALINSPETQPVLLFSYIKLLGQAGTADHFSQIIALIKSQGAMLARELIDAIEAICYRQKIRPLPDDMQKALHALFHMVNNPTLRFEIFNFLLQMEEAAMLPLVREQLQSEDLMMQMACVDALASYGHAQDVQSLNALLSTAKEEDLKDMISEAIGAINTRVNKEE